MARCLPDVNGNRSGRKWKGSEKLGTRNGNEPLGMGGNAIEKDIHAHLYFC